MIDIRRYAGFFHDGSIIDIQHCGNQMIISMESAEVDEDDINDVSILAKDDRIRGKLHLEEIKAININTENFLQTLKKIGDEGDIFNFEVNENFIILDIEWINFPPNPKINEFSTLKIEAENIWWENIPHLEDFNDI